MALKLGIVGANGKMGEYLIKSCPKFKDSLDLKTLFVSRNFVSSGKSLNTDIFTTSDLEKAKDLNIIIDFSNPETTLQLGNILNGNTESFIVSGVTGFSESQMQTLKNLSKGVRILHSANFSFGIKAIKEAVFNLSSVLKNYDVEILEKHHSLKKDAPSGTALMLGETVASARNQDFTKVKKINREGVRKVEDIGFACVRQGKIAGFHEVSLANENERIWIGHEAFSKNIFAEGALNASILAYNKFKKIQNGFFTLNDI
jgi:4-hydroxy-tetrahydrodipicolinate reductase